MFFKIKKFAEVAKKIDLQGVTINDDISAEWFRKVLKCKIKLFFVQRDILFSELLGAFAGDGWISKGNSGYSLFITGNPKEEKEYYSRIKYLVFKKFGLIVQPREFYYWKTYGISITNQEIIHIFMSAGMPSGHKSSIVKVPNFIQNNPILFTPFLRGVFDTDGSIYFEKSYNKNASKWQKTHHHLPVVSFVTTSEFLSISLEKMLKYLGFNFTRKKRPPAKTGNVPAYQLRLKGKANVRAFFDNIQPENPKHLNKLKIWLEKGFY